MYDMGKEARREMGLKGREHVLKNYNFDDFNSAWVDFMTKVYEKEGSWGTRKNYNGITFKEIT